VVTDLKAYETEGAQLVAEKIHLVYCMKKHLRKMDELKQSVQLAVHEQKIHYLFTNWRRSICLEP
jgi:preprotein translocase subunit SecA